ncbi:MULTISPECIES: peptidoglycan editing factor PgeF [Alphaproteobacteria]|uniref:Purine nucleoside phosphorylase n=2 Tax=Alphaproteobacteria TaxID=28211 RepID=A0A512HEP2_9HYPH|nr:MULTISPECIES: peptidoglycan editing factor PgeF [Alphaproteobacteria]GEO83918.1 laccase domain protein [Ciceribacter naphthalenivorans]GLR21204.1 laccase domain protein [Ciceribacter naphthalenivorans]GLT04060.1 laccase domain protein [Sphingomonas psychrolutea]
MQEHPLPEPITSALFADAESKGIRHGFFTRNGGVSEGIYRGLNVGLGSNDEKQKVQENRRRVSAWFGLAPEKLATVNQVHSADVVVVERDHDGARPAADALVTASPGIILGVLSADCGPVLFADAEAGIIGAAHAGWKGALGGVLENTILAMLSLGARREAITACLGPSICGVNYEVGPEFVDRFIAENPSFEAFFTPSTRPGHAMFDLQGLTVKRLTDAGVRAESLGICTYADPDNFYSYRRTTHAGEPDYGRQISAIAIRED